MLRSDFTESKSTNIDGFQMCSHGFVRICSFLRKHTWWLSKGFDTIDVLQAMDTCFRLIWLLGGLGSMQNTPSGFEPRPYIAQVVCKEHTQGNISGGHETKHLRFGL